MYASVPTLSRYVAVLQVAFGVANSRKMELEREEYVLVFSGFPESCVARISITYL